MIANLLYPLRQQYKKKRDILIPALKEKKLPAIQSEATFFLWQKAPPGMTGLALCQKLIDIGIVYHTWNCFDRSDDATQPRREFYTLCLNANARKNRRSCRKNTSRIRLRQSRKRLKIISGRFPR